jgi:hypothetical protein
LIGSCPDVDSTRTLLQAKAGSLIGGYQTAGEVATQNKHGACAKALHQPFAHMSQRIRAMEAAVKSAEKRLAHDIGVCKKFLTAQEKPGPQGERTAFRAAYDDKRQQLQNAADADADNSSDVGIYDTDDTDAATSVDVGASSAGAELATPVLVTLASAPARPLASRLHVSMNVAVAVSPMFSGWAPKKLGKGTFTVAVAIAVAVSPQ